VNETQHDGLVNQINDILLKYSSEVTVMFRVDGNGDAWVCMQALFEPPLRTHWHLDMPVMPEDKRWVSLGAQEVPPSVLRELDEVITPYAFIERLEGR
jgi:hypothetical protein